jgi:hypothetical protein
MSKREPKEGPDYLSLGCEQLAIGTPTPQSAILKMRGCLTTYRNIGTPAAGTIKVCQERSMMPTKFRYRNSDQRKAEAGAKPTRSIFQ